MAGQGELIHEQKGIYSFLTVVTIENLDKETYHVACPSSIFRRKLSAKITFFVQIFWLVYL